MRNRINEHLQQSRRVSRQANRPARWAGLVVYLALDKSLSTHHCFLFNAELDSKYFVVIFDTILVEVRLIKLCHSQKLIY